MAKTIMISNPTYDKLKKMKGKDKSFSDTINELISKCKDEKLDLSKYFGILKDDKEFDEILKEIKNEWKKWDKTYA